MLQTTPLYNAWMPAHFASSKPFRYHVYEYMAPGKTGLCLVPPDWTSFRLTQALKKLGVRVMAAKWRPDLEKGKRPEAEYDFTKKDNTP